MSQTVHINRDSAAVQPKETAFTAASLFQHIPGKSMYFRWHGENIHYRQAGDGPPLVLVHAPDVGACSLEWRRNMETLAESHRVLAIDLPGYGLSDAHDGTYTAETYTRFLADFIREVPGPHSHAMGSVLGASFLVHVADQHPELLDRLLLIAPAGVSALRPNPLCGMTYQMMRLPGLSNAIYGSNTSRYSILEHLQKDVYENEEIAGQSEVDWRYWISHRPNADSVERSRIAGLLNTDIRAAAARLNQSILLAWGRHCKQPPVSDAEEFCELNPNARIDIFERSALVPHEEEPNRFNEMAKAFFYTGSPVMH